MPEYVADWQSAMPEAIRACFVGYAEMSPEDKVGLMRAHAVEGEGDWMSDDDSEAFRMAAHLKAVSERLRDDCEALGLTYFESRDYEKTVADVVAFLREDLRG